MLSDLFNPTFLGISPGVIATSCFFFLLGYSYIDIYKIICTETTLFRAYSFRAYSFFGGFFIYFKQNNFFIKFVVFSLYKHTLSVTQEKRKVAKL